MRQNVATVAVIIRIRRTSLTGAIAKKQNALGIAGIVTQRNGARKNGRRNLQQSEGRQSAEPTSANKRKNTSDDRRKNTALSNKNRHKSRP